MLLDWILFSVNSKLSPCCSLLSACWASSSVFLVFKNSDPSYYRPISPLPHSGKTLDDLILFTLGKRLNSQSFLSDKQCRIRYSCSAADVLAIIAERVCQSLGKNGEARAVAFDISNAFDMIYYTGLIHIFLTSSSHVSRRVSFSE